MFKRGIFCFFIAMAITFSGFSEEIKVTGTPPTFRANDDRAEPFIETFNDLLASTFGDMLGEIEKNVNDVLPAGLINTDNLLNGFGTSSVFASHGATMWAYADYKFLSISIGSILGIKLPNNMLSDLLSGKELDIENLMEGNTTFGIIPQVINLHVGMNPSAKWEIMPKNLSFGLRVGFFGLPDLNIPIHDGTDANLNLSTFTIGLTANYQLVKTYELLNGMIKWRGVNIGSGIIFQTTKLDLSVPFRKEESRIPDLGPLTNLSLELEPRATFNMEINTVTIPIEASTAIKLLIFNIPFGIGFDFGMGGSKVSVGAESDVSILGGNKDLVEQDKKGSLSVGIENNNIPPTFFNFKIMTGIGFTFGDVFVIDMPITFYIKDGFNLGITLGLRL